MTDGRNGMPSDELNLLLIVFEPAGRGNGSRSSNRAFLRTLRSHPSSSRLTDSVWTVRTSRPLPAVFDSLDRLLGPDDRLFVGSLTGEAAWRNLEDGYDWLNDAFQPGGSIAGRAA